MKKPDRLAATTKDDDRNLSYSTSLIPGNGMHLEELVLLIASQFIWNNYFDWSNAIHQDKQGLWGCR
jgi:hypothetical protein